MMNYDYNYGNDAAVGAGSGAWSGGFLAFIMGMIIFIIFAVAAHIYIAICLMKIAKKTDTPNAWFAWIPFLNFVLMLKIAKKPVWWILVLILFFIPFINFLASLTLLVISVIIWMKIAEAVGKPSWWGIMVIVPVMNLIMPGYLAFSKMEEMATPSYVPPPPLNPPVQPLSYNPPAPPPSPPVQPPPPPPPPPAQPLI
jgi:hypothetical protein